ncbi:MAG: CBS domain-containing protein [Desulfobacterales bacterium]|nr:CBS domain-containing protein [Desulfobacterales bacterium]
MQIATTHKNTDFDAFASLIAATLLYPKAIAVIPKIINPNVKDFLSMHKDLFEVKLVKEIDTSKVTRMIVVDTNSWSRLERMKDLENKDDFEIHVWDHHDETGDLEPIWKCQEKMGAAITLMIREIKKRNIELTPMQATLFLAGIYEDTGNLTFSSTTAEDAYAAAYLLENKADLAILNTFLSPAYGEKQKNILFKMLETAQRTKIKGHIISINKTEIDGHVNNLALVVKMYSDILNVEAAFGIFEKIGDGGCIIIGRSKTSALDIGEIMRGFNGGGHPGAGSAMLKSANLDEIEKRIIDLILGNQKAGVQISDIMSFPVLTVSSDTSMQDVAMVLRDKGCTGFPVVEGEKLVGIISRRDFRKARKESQLSAPVKAFMSTNIKTITPGKSPVEAARIMVKHDIGRLPVVDEDGKMIGIVTRTDSMHYFYNLMPE